MRLRKQGSYNLSHDTRLNALVPWHTPDPEKSSVAWGVAGAFHVVRHVHLRGGLFIVKAALAGFR